MAATSSLPRSFDLQANDQGLTGRIVLRGAFNPVFSGGAQLVSIAIVFGGPLLAAASLGAYLWWKLSGNVADVTFEVAAFAGVAAMLRIGLIDAPRIRQRHIHALHFDVDELRIGRWSVARDAITDVIIGTLSRGRVTVPTLRIEAGSSSLFILDPHHDAGDLERLAVLVRG